MGGTCGNEWIIENSWSNNSSKLWFVGIRIGRKGWKGKLREYHPQRQRNGHKNIQTSTCPYTIIIYTIILFSGPKHSCFHPHSLLLLNTGQLFFVICRQLRPRVEQEEVDQPSPMDKQTYGSRLGRVD